MLHRDPIQLYGVKLPGLATRASDRAQREAGSVDARPVNCDEHQFLLQPDDLPTPIQGRTW
jgi:hypothetical protein